MCGLAFLAAPALLAPPAQAANRPAGAIIEQAAFADVTPEGFEAIAAVIPSLIPSEIPMGDLGAEYEGEFGQCWLGGYAYSVTGMSVGIEVMSASIIPRDGYLDVTADIMVWVNDASNPFDLYVSAECLEDTCNSYIDPFPLTVTTTMALAVGTGDTGEPVLDATIGDIVLTYDLLGEDIHLDDCFIGTVEDVFNFFGVSLYDLVISQLGGVLDGALADVGPQLETTIEDAFSSATISQSLDVNGATIDLNLFPSAVVIQPEGVRIQMSGNLDGAANECIAAYDPGGSLQTDSLAPDIGAVPTGVDSPYHLAVTLSDDFTNQALYALWRGGLLCYTLEEGGVFPVDTSILNLLTGDTFLELFPESAPVVMRTSPRAPPTAAYVGDSDINLDLKDLGLDFFAELDGRKARMVTIDLNGTAGANLGFDGTTGSLGVEVVLDAANITPTVSYNEFYPDTNATIEASFASKFGGLLDTVIGGLLGDLAFALPSFSGIGLQDLQISESGQSSDWLGVFTWVGAVTYESADGCGGCGGDGSTTSSSCGGCTVAGTPVPSPVFWGLGALVLLRRRNKSA